MSDTDKNGAPDVQGDCRETCGCGMPCTLKEHRRAGAEWLHACDVHWPAAHDAPDKNGAPAARRAPVQGVGHSRLPTWHPDRHPDARPPGTVSWEEHVRAWEAPTKRGKATTDPEPPPDDANEDWGMTGTGE